MTSGHVTYCPLGTPRTILPLCHKIEMSATQFIEVHLGEVNYWRPLYWDEQQEKYVPSERSDKPKAIWHRRTPPNHKLRFTMSVFLLGNGVPLHIVKQWWVERWNATRDQLSTVDYIDRAMKAKKAGYKRWWDVVRQAWSNEIDLTEDNTDYRLFSSKPNPYTRQTTIGLRDEPLSELEKELMAIPEDKRVQYIRDRNMKKYGRKSRFHRPMLKPVKRPLTPTTAVKGPLTPKIVVNPYRKPRPIVNPYCKTRPPVKIVNPYRKKVQFKE